MLLQLGNPRVADVALPQQLVNAALQRRHVRLPGGDMLLQLGNPRVADVALPQQLVNAALQRRHVRLPGGDMLLQLGNPRVADVALPQQLVNARQRTFRVLPPRRQASFELGDLRVAHAPLPEQLDDPRFALRNSNPLGRTSRTTRFERKTDTTRSQALGKHIGKSIWIVHRSRYIRHKPEGRREGLGIRFITFYAQSRQSFGAKTGNRLEGGKTVDFAQIVGQVGEKRNIGGGFELIQPSAFAKLRSRQPLRFDEHQRRLILSRFQRCRHTDASFNQRKRHHAHALRQRQCKLDKREIFKPPESGKTELVFENERPAIQLGPGGHG